jgi:putative endonuclease
MAFFLFPVILSEVEGSHNGLLSFSRHPERSRRISLITNNMNHDKSYFTYIATNKFNNVLYVGITNSLLNRFYQHYRKINENSFTAKYNINKIIYYEIFDNASDAIYREKQLKGWVRAKKIKLVNEINPDWDDLIEKNYDLDEILRQAQDDEQRDPSTSSG